MKYWWRYFQPSVLSAEWGAPREKIVAVLGELELAGDIILKVSGVRQAYRMKKDPGDLKILADAMNTLFQQREHADLDRLGQVLGLSSQRTCLTAYLTKYFGEILDGPCGHCDRCRGLPAKVIRRPKTRPVTDGELQLVGRLVEERHAALGAERQLARFLCGMTSPAATRARLNRHDAFGMLGDTPFSEVLVIASAAL